MKLRASLPVRRETYTRTRRQLQAAPAYAPRPARAGLTDWNAIEDRTREMVSRPRGNRLPRSCRRGRIVSRGPLADQGHRVEVWVEKTALTGVIGPVCDDTASPTRRRDGNTSTSEVYKAGKRLAGYIEDGLTPVVLQLADHDPKGVAMTRDLARRLSLYARDDIEVRRLGLSMDQARRYRPPPNPVKESDTTTPAYIARFGTSDCWELDALSPNVIAELITREMVSLIDQRNWAKAKKREDTGRRSS